MPGGFQEEERVFKSNINLISNNIYIRACAIFPNGRMMEWNIGVLCTLI